MKKTKILSMKGFENFKCIGLNCSDSCCHSWCVFVDKKTYKEYKKLKDDFGNKICKNIKLTNKNNSMDYGTLDLNEKGYCKYYNDDGLCLIQKNLGEKYLCYTCKTYPRLELYCDGLLQKSLALSCPSVVDILLSIKEPIEFNLNEKAIQQDKIKAKLIEESYPKNNYLNYNTYFEIMSLSIDIMQNRKVPIWKRLSYLGIVIEDLQKLYNENEEEENIIKRIDTYKASMLDDSIYDEFDKIVSTCDNKYIIYKEILNSINQMVKIYRCKNKNNFLETLKGMNEKSSEITVQELKDSKEKIINNFISDNEYIFENYLVHYIYTYNFPLHGENMIGAYRLLVIRYLYLQLFTSLIAAYKKTISIEDVRDCIYYTSRCLDHSTSKQKYIESIYNNIELNISQILILIK